jgi:putative glutamine amidotransferase
MAGPLIAVTGPTRGAIGPRTLVSLAVHLYGGRTVQLRPGDQHAVKTHDGVVVTGGHDVEPQLYAAESEVEPNYDTARDALEMAVIKDALARGLPLLGICRGAQLLNVCLGGTLHQELQSRRQKTSNRWTVLPLKTLCIADEPETRHCILSTLFRHKRSRINSLHNQSIALIGDRLLVTGRDLDGIVQAIEDPSRNFLMGVQWHPEFLLYLSKQRAIFKALVKCASQKANSANRQPK